MPPERDAAPAEPGPYAWYMLAVLVLVYVANYVDRQLLTILAPELKRDLGISDAEFGFLYGTAFGVFYALFGIPLGRLADRWSRTRLLALGLTVWSLTTALSGLSRSFAQIAAARVGVGIGEATAAPCAYSLIGDYFPPHRRATALGLYATGLFIGGGVSLFLGSTIAQRWNAAFAGGAVPLGLAGWQAAFLLVGLPGLLLAGWVASLREPARGRFDSDAAMAPPANVTAQLLRDLGDVVPPFTLIAAVRRGRAALLANLTAAVVVALAAGLLVGWTGDAPQWLALGVGSYAVLSWLASVRHGDPATGALLRSRAFAGITVGYGAFALVGYANLAFTPLYAIQELGADPAAAGLALGSIGGLGGVAGMILGGIVADRLARGGEHWRVIVAAIGAVGGMVCHAAMFSTASLFAYYAIVFFMQVGNSVSLGGASGLVVNLAPPRLRGTAAAAFVLGSTMIGLGLGPYAAGKLSVLLGDLGLGLLAILAVAPLVIALFWLAYDDLREKAV